jgi:transmembrane sensor
MFEKELNHLLERFVAEKATKEERQLLRNYMLKPEFRPYVEKFIEQQLYTSTEIFSGLNTDAVFNNIITPIEQKNTAIPSAHRVHFLRRGFLKYAAAIILILGAAAYFVINNKKQTADKEIVSVNVKAPATEKAMITLANGKIINLDNTPAGIITTEGKITIEKLNDGSIVYRGAGNEEIIYNTITVPKGSKVANLTLADGTQVYLNTGSALKYPVAFSGKDRRVEVTGEAYFEVAKNATKPFIVSSIKESIMVLGTSFNVNSYIDEPHSKTSLIEGSIKINNKILQPGQAYTNGNIISTNIQNDIAWKNGYFNLEGLTLKETMRQLARWYDVDVVYETTIPEERLYGKMDRNLTLKDALSGLEGVIAHFELKGKTIYVRPL